MNTRLALLILCLFSFPFSFSLAQSEDAQERRFYYQIQIPESARSCDEEASELAKRFSTITGFSVVDRSCRGLTKIVEEKLRHTQYSLALTYMAKRETRPYTAFLGYEAMNTPNPAMGAYETYGACVADIPNQAKTYETQTGFKVVAATCQKGTFVEDYKFVLRIDGLSADPKLVEPKTKLYGQTIKFWGAADAALIKAVDSLLAGLGAAVVLRNENTAFYYRKEPALVRYHMLGIFEVENDCTSQMKEAESVFSKLHSKAIIVRCLSYQRPRYETVYYLEGVRDLAGGEATFGTDTFPYSSNSECVADKPRAKDEAASRGYHPIGAICRPASVNGRHEMQMFMYPWRAFGG